MNDHDDIMPYYLSILPTGFVLLILNILQNLELSPCKPWVCNSNFFQI